MVFCSSHVFRVPGFPFGISEKLPGRLRGPGLGDFEWNYRPACALSPPGSCGGCSSLNSSPWFAYGVGGRGPQALEIRRPQGSGVRGDAEREEKRLS